MQPPALRCRTPPSSGRPRCPAKVRARRRSAGRGCQSGRDARQLAPQLVLPAVHAAPTARCPRGRAAPRARLRRQGRLLQARQRCLAGHGGEGSIVRSVHTRPPVVVLTESSAPIAPQAPRQHRPPPPRAQPAASRMRRRRTRQRPRSMRRPLQARRRWLAAPARPPPPPLRPLPDSRRPHHKRQPRRPRRPQTTCTPLRRLRPSTLRVPPRVQLQVGPWATLWFQLGPTQRSASPCCFDRAGGQPACAHLLVPAPACCHG